jgi:hypothetical protein
MSKLISTAVLGLMTVSGLIVSGSCKAEGRSFEECRAIAIAQGVSPRYASSDKVERQYLRYKAAGTALHPRGQIARCMSGRS